MNSNPETSPTSPVSTTLSDSSANQSCDCPKSATEFRDLPLRNLLTLDQDNMTLDQLTLFLNELRNRANSSQSFRASQLAEERELSENVKGKKDTGKKVTVEELNSLLEGFV